MARPARLAASRGRRRAVRCPGPAGSHLARPAGGRPRRRGLPGRRPGGRPRLPRRSVDQQRGARRTVAHGAVGGRCENREVTVVVQRSIDIDAPASTVWAVVSDVERWPEWTASITSATRSRTGPLAVGERGVVTQPRLPTLTYTVTEVDEGRSFTWSAGSAVSRGVGEHVLTPRVNGGCTATLRLTQHGPGPASWGCCSAGSPAGTSAWRPRDSR